MIEQRYAQCAKCGRRVLVDRVGRGGTYVIWHCPPNSSKRCEGTDLPAVTP
jgi:ribosomal protein L37AE/L43A